MIKKLLFIQPLVCRSINLHTRYGVYLTSVIVYMFQYPSEEL